MTRRPSGFHGDESLHFFCLTYSRLDVGEMGSLEKPTGTNKKRTKPKPALFSQRTEKEAA